MKTFNQISMDLIAFWQKTDKKYFWAAFAGLWFGAATHILTDVLGSMIKRLGQML